VQYDCYYTAYYVSGFGLAFHSAAQYITRWMAALYVGIGPTYFSSYLYYKYGLSLLNDICSNIEISCFSAWIKFEFNDSHLSAIQSVLMQKLSWGIESCEAAGVFAK